MMAIVFITYYGLYLPSGVDSFLVYDVTIKHYVYRVTNMLFFMNALLNPIIYRYFLSLFYVFPFPVYFSLGNTGIRYVKHWNEINQNPIEPR